MNLLSTGTSALLAFQRALATVGHNVANANTPGYSRQRVEFANLPGQTNGAGFIGAGVQTTSVVRQADAYVFARLLDGAAETGRLDQLAGLATRLDRTFTDAGTGLNGPLSDFITASRALIAQPASNAARDALLSAAGSLADRFHTLDGQLQALDREINGRLIGGVDEVNRLSSEIARVNVEIVREFGRSGGQPPNDLLDQRDRLATELSGLIGVTTALQDDGALNVFTLGGQALVVGSTTQRLTTIADPYQPERLEPAIQSQGATIRLGSNAVGGELGGLIEFRRTGLDPSFAQLGRLAIGITEAVNAQHAQGLDALGTLGGPFFTAIAPRVTGHSGNTGSATLAATVADPQALPLTDLVLRFDGSLWTASERGSTVALPVTGSGTAGDPLRVAGLAVQVSGSAATGDRFLVRPTSGAGSAMTVAITDPGRIAAATPLAASADLGNLGSARPGLEILDVGAAGFLSAHSIVFTDAGNYTLDGTGPFAYDPAAGITGPGFRLRLDGSVQAGDRFEVVPRGPGSSDNGNIRRLAEFGDLGLFDAGTVSITAGLDRMTVAIGATARDVDLARAAQAQISAGISAEREAIAGVNLDEEAANLLRFQQAYQAAAQVIGTADTLFQTLLAAVRR